MNPLLQTIADILDRMERAWLLVTTQPSDDLAGARALLCIAVIESLPPAKISPLATR